jgi:NAD-reducing hydrogenase small subunit
LATVWLAGCSGCHLSLLDLDEWLFVLAEQAEIVYSPLVSDVKIYPESVDVCLVEGAVASSDQLAMARILRERTRLVVAFGDCAISSHLPGLRNRLAAEPGGGATAVLERAYDDLADLHPQRPWAPGQLPELLERVLPLHEVIPVDLWLPGCPPPPERIRQVLEALIHGDDPRLEGPEGLRFG